MNADTLAQSTAPSAPALSRRIATWYGQFKATGSTDPSVLYAKMKELKRGYAQAKLAGWLMVLGGLPGCIIFIGFLTIPAGLCTLAYVYWKTSAITAAYRRYCADVGVQAL